MRNQLAVGSIPAGMCLQTGTDVEGAVAIFTSPGDTRGPIKGTFHTYATIQNSISTARCYGIRLQSSNV